MYADLHRHLDGSLRLETARELATKLGVQLPSKFYFSPGMGLRPALALFDTSLRLLREPQYVQRVAAEICEDAAAQNVSTLEIRFGPQLHRGAPAEEIVDAALEGIAGRAGLILCGLYGEAPTVLERWVQIAVDRPGVVGIDLAGGPQSGDAFALSDYAGVFQEAAQAGLGRTVHAGEGRSVEEIRIAVESLAAQRIGHGVTLLDEPSVVDLVRERGVVIEACITSNVHTGVIPSESEHPLPRWLQAGVAACVCTDNTLFSQTTSVREHGLAATLPGMGDELLQQAIAHGHRAAFPRA